MIMGMVQLSGGLYQYTNVCIIDRKKYLGSKTFTVVRRDFEFEESMNVEHMPSLSVVQRRRREMCATINNTLCQMVEDRVVPYYEVVFPHGMDWLTGQIHYETTIPTWWYYHSSIPFGVPPQAQCAMSLILTEELVLQVAAGLDNPSRLVLTSRSHWILIQQRQMTVVSWLASQVMRPARLLRWWGHFVYSEGPPFIPMTRDALPIDDADFLERRRARWEAEELHDDEMVGMAGNREGWIAPTFYPHEPAPPPPDDNEIVFWRDSLEILEAAVLDAQLWGTRVPRGIVMNPEEGTSRFIFSESNSEMSDDTLELEGTAPPTEL